MEDEKPTVVTGDKNLGGDRVTAADRSLTEGPFVKVTPDILEGMRQAIEARKRELKEDFPKLVADLTPEQRLAAACWVVKALHDHAKEGGSFRYLIYERMGFGPEAYVPMQLSGALDLSNAMPLWGEESKTDGG